MYNEQENNGLWEESNPQQAPEKPAKAHKAGTLIVLALCCSLIGGAIGAGAMLFAGRQSPANSSNTVDLYEGQRENSVIEMHSIDTNKLMSPAEVYAANVNSTVGITTSVTTNFWGYQTTSAASGSGFVLSADGYILTNYHVIEGSSAITVSFYDGTSAEATLVGYDSSNDIAVLKVEATNLVPVILGDSDNTNVGDTVVAIGNPLGELTFSLTAGAISALDREVTTSTGITMNLIQTDCAINSGNSGGALFNLYGEVIGITNAKYSGSGSSSQASIDNIGFAIPVNGIRSIVKSIIEKGYVAKPYIGVAVADVSEESQGFGLPKGAAVREVTPDSPAEVAGLKPSDIITKVGDTPINGSSDLVGIIGKAAPGDKYLLTVYRQGEILEMEISVGEQVQSAQTQQQPQSLPQTVPGWGSFGY